MPEPELLDVVDTFDRVIGQTTKARAHTSGEIHRVVVVYLFNGAGELYMQSVGRLKLWDHSVGGHVKKNEDYDSAVAREAKEELALNKPLLFVGKIYSDEAKRHSNYRHMYAIYTARVGRGWKFEPNNEVRQLDALPIEKVTELMKVKPEAFTAGFLATMKYYQTKGSKPR